MGFSFGSQATSGGGGGSSGPIEFMLDSVATRVEEDTGTPANSIPLPIKALDSSGIEVDFATETTQASIDATIALIYALFNLNFGASTGAIRSASQIGNATGAADFNSGNVGAQTLRVVLATDQPTVPVSGSLTVTSGNYVDKSTLDFSSNPVLNSAYTELTPSLAANVNNIQVYNTTLETLILAVGASSSEVDSLYIMPGGVESLQSVQIASGSRVSLKSAGQNVTYGSIFINYFG